MSEYMEECPKFTDTLGRTWFLVVNGGTVIRSKNELKIDLAAIGCDLEEIAKLSLPINVEKLIRILYLVCESQCEEQAIDAMGFATGLGDGDVLEKALRAFAEAMIYFFQPAPRREAMLQAIDLTWGVGEELVAIHKQAIAEAHKKYLAQSITKGSFGTQPSPV